jgi:hypothetical protein
MPNLHAAAAALALAADPGNPWLANDLANAHWLDDALPEALSWARWATRAQEGVHPLAWRTLGNVWLDLGHFKAAEAAYGRADPLGIDAATQFNRSKAMLGAGQWQRAWQLAEWRLRLQPPPRGVLPGESWQGWPAAREVTIWAEQGLGDTLQFVRWLPLLLASGRRVQLLVQPPLLRLLQEGLQWLGPALTVLSDEGLTEAGSPPGGCHGSLLSLPWLLGQPQPPWPGAPGYLRLPAAGSARPAGPARIGLVWGGGRYLDGHAKERDYRRKSVLGEPLLALLQHLPRRPLELVNLQVGPDRAAAAAAGDVWADGLAEDGDFLALAQMLLGLDLLICVDTAAAHLAGALGLEAWLLLPWAAASRWQRGTSSTPWYPSLRLWRQPRHGDWLALWPPLLEALDRLFSAVG